MDRIPLTKRWFEGSVFLSTDLTQSFFDDLWVPCENHLELQRGLRTLLSDALEGEAYYTNQDPRGYRIMEWFYSNYGAQRFQEFNSWIRHILVLEGPDRTGETFWTPLTYQISNQTEGETTAPEWIVLLMKEVASFQQTLKSPLDDKIEVAEDQPLHEWDQRVLEIQDSSADAVLTKASLIAEYNIFLTAWERDCTALQYAELYQIWQLGKNTGVTLGMDPADLAFPGAWRFELVQFLSKFPNPTNRNAE
jgi:hypothetical protein